jgi:hypothetical protein
MSPFIEPRTTTEYFKTLVEQAISRQRLSPSELSCFYLVSLLDEFVRTERIHQRAGLEETPSLAEMLGRAVSSTGARRLALFRLTGDVALFVSGYFGDSLYGRTADATYYASIGRYGYGRAARLAPGPAAAGLFAELSAKFVRFRDVLAEVSETASLTDNVSLLRVYERWLSGGGERSAARLRQQGVLSNASRRVH